MKPKTILRLLKAVIFFVAINGYAINMLYKKPILLTISFALAFAMYLIELYNGVKQ